ncbi:MAG: hypothetical protein LBF95_02800 [Treponema sp.]|jgi:hypothetical protein|nr:hypothetical protein [Treponema sp.]
MRKSGLFVLGMLIVLFALAGCTTGLKSAYNGTTWNIGVPAAKNVEIIGLVHYEGLVENGTGEKVTYDALLREAEKLGGNGIVNIMIDVKREGMKFLFWMLNSKETWYGSALAIKYTNENLTETITLNDGKTIQSNVPLSGNEGGMEPSSALFGAGSGKKFLGIF